MTTSVQRLPIVGVAAVIFDRSDTQRDRVLLIQRGRAPAKGLWSVPGGRVEHGETLVAACRREIREETGLDVNLREIVTVIERIDREYHYVVIDYWGEVVGGTLKSGSDAADAAWVYLHQLNKLDTTDGLQDVITKAHQMAITQTAVP